MRAKMISFLQLAAEKKTSFWQASHTIFGTSNLDRALFKFITSLILHVKHEKTHREQPMFSCLHPIRLGYWSLRNFGYKQKTFYCSTDFLFFILQVIDFRLTLTWLHFLLENSRCPTLKGEIMLNMITTRFILS